MSNTDGNYIGVLLEQIRDQNQAVLEAVGDIQRKVARLDDIERDVVEVKQDMKVVRAAVVDVSRGLEQHKSMPAHMAHGRA